MFSFQSAKTDDKKDDKKKKKKELDIELHHMPAEFTTLATFHLPLEDFLDGEDMVEEVFARGELEVDSQVDISEAKSNAKAKKGASEKRKSSAQAKKDKKGEESFRNFGVKTLCEQDMRHFRQNIHFL